MEELVFLGIVIFIFRALAANAKKKKTAQKKAEQGGAAKPPARRGWGEWADMLGKVAGEEEAPAPKARTATAHPAFPPEPPPRPPTFGEVARSTAPTFKSLEGFSYPDEREELESVKPTREAPMLHNALQMQFDAPALVKGVIFAEVLTRPAQRRRPGRR